jgi:hypothetical protein
MPVMVTGVNETIRAMKKMVAGDAIRIIDGLEDSARDILKLGNHYCPKKTGALVRTGAWVSTGSGFGAIVGINYGGPDAPYALWVHENLEAMHIFPTCAKWLERATRECKRKIERHIKRKMSVKVYKTIE